MKNFTKLSIALFAFIGSFMPGYAQDGSNQVNCDDWAVYLADITGGDFTSIYAVDFADDAANLSLIATSEIEVHIAYNAANNLIYAVSNADGSYRTLDPHAENPEFSDAVTVDADIDRITMAAFNNDGKLIIGNSGSDLFYAIDVTSNMIEVFDSYAPIEGGDIAFDENGNPYMATKEGNGGLYAIVDAELGWDDLLIGDLPGNVTGMALSSSNQLLVSRQGASEFLIRELSGADNGETIDILLDGAPFQTSAGDMASGCADGNNNEDDCNYALYYKHIANGDNSANGLYGVTLNDDGTADVDFITAEGDNHIALSPDGSLIYMVGGSNIQTYEVSTGDFINDVSIFNGANGANLSNFPAAVADADGNVFIAGAGNNVWQVNPQTGEATNIANGIPVNGGDLIFAPTGDEGEDELWIITRNNNKFRKVLEPGVHFSVDVPEINGAAVLENGNVLLANGDQDGEDGFIEISLADGSIVATYDTELAIFNGDMAGGCTGNDQIISECYGLEILEFNQGTKTNGSPVEADRSDATKALGEPDRSNAAGGFVSLGDGGSITIGFAGLAINGPGADIRIWETSFSGDNCGAGGNESADIELSEDGVTWVSAGTICRDGEIDMGPLGLDFVALIRITSVVGTSSDGYDVDGIESIHGCEPPQVDLCEGENGSCYATEFSNFQQGGLIPGGGAISPARSIPENALGEPEGTDEMVFVSLGQGGHITFGFGGIVPNLEGDDITVVETTFGNPGCESFPEFADVYVSIDSVDFYFVGTVCKSDNSVDISDAEVELDCVRYVKVVNNDLLTTQAGDGFDIDGIIAIHNCANEPIEQDPFCTNETVYIEENLQNQPAFRLTAMGLYQECNGQLGRRWRIRNYSGSAAEVFYNFAGAPAQQGPFQLEDGETVLFTDAFFNQGDNTGATMRIFVDGEQVDVKAHGGSTKDLSECLPGGCPDAVEPVTQSQDIVAFDSYPNPTEGASQATFTTLVTTRTTLEVYDMNGRSVATLFNGIANAGQEYLLNFDGSGLPNGIYIYRLTTETETVVEKFMIAK
jgi:hypothetical protein